MINNLDDKRKNTIWDEVKIEMGQREITVSDRTIKMCALEWGVTNDIARYKLDKLVAEGKLTYRFGYHNVRIYSPAE